MTLVDSETSARPNPRNNRVLHGTPLLEGQRGFCVTIYPVKHRLKPPEPIRKDGIIGVRLTRGKVAWIDAGDWPIVAPYVWRTLKRGHTFYAIARVNGHTKTMQDLLMNPPDGMEVDHWQNPCGLWNFRWNLRVCTHQENMLNSRRCHGLACLREMVELPDV